MSPGKTLRSVHLGNPGPESVDELARFVGRRAAERLWSDGRCLDGAVFTGEEIMRFAEPLG